jgi:hypothetical protein
MRVEAVWTAPFPSVGPAPSRLAAERILQLRAVLFKTCPAVHTCVLFHLRGWGFDTDVKGAPLTKGHSFVLIFEGLGDEAISCPVDVKHFLFQTTLRCSSST